MSRDPYPKKKVTVLYASVQQPALNSGNVHGVHTSRHDDSFIFEQVRPSF
jgi:hypothetical protein